MISRTVVAALLTASFAFGCGGPERRTVGLDVDLFLNPTSGDLTDVLLQTGITKRLADDNDTKSQIIHVRVLPEMTGLSVPDQAGHFVH